MKHNYSLLIFLLLFSSSSFAQTQFWSDTFEDTGAPSSGTRTPSSNVSSGGPPATRYFWRCGTANISTVSSYSNIEGTKFWAGEDHRLSPITQTPHQNITWSSINISGKTGLSFKGMFASGPGNFDAAPTTVTTDYLILEYRIDGGTWQNGLRFFPFSTTIATYLSLETTGDSLGEGVVLINSANFTEFNFNIPGTGTTLDMRLKAQSNSTSEEWAIDNFRLLYTSSLPVTLTDFDVVCDQITTTINWTVESEENLSHYVIEESDDLQNFRGIGIIQPTEHDDLYPIHYEFTTESRNDELNYFRLKSIDLDGSEATYDPITRNCKASESLLLNQVIDKDLLTLYFSKPGLSVELLDLSGRVIFSTKETAENFLTTPLNQSKNVLLLRVIDNASHSTESKLILPFK